ncbi:MAG: hypothetical protein ABI833_00500 [Acidobacteriota bacterium]
MHIGKSAVLGYLAIQSFAWAAADPRSISVCEALTHRAELNGKEIALQGVVELSDHGEWIRGEECSSPIVLDGIKWSAAVYLHNSSGEKTGTKIVVLGQFQTRVPFLPYQREGKTHGDGFGPFGDSPAQLVFKKTLKREAVARKDSKAEKR